jgi:hypothetical protein
MHSSSSFEMSARLSAMEISTSIPRDTRRMLFFSVIFSLEILATSGDRYEK